VTILLLLLQTLLLLCQGMAVVARRHTHVDAGRHLHRQGLQVGGGNGSCRGAVVGRAVVSEHRHWHLRSLRERLRRRQHGREAVVVIAAAVVRGGSSSGLSVMDAAIVTVHAHVHAHVDVVARSAIMLRECSDGLRYVVLSPLLLLMLNRTSTVAHGSRRPCWQLLALVHQQGRRDRSIELVLMAVQVTQLQGVARVAVAAAAVVTHA